MFCFFEVSRVAWERFHGFFLVYLALEVSGKMLLGCKNHAKDSGKIS